jgi:hypothetical protein
MNDKSIYQGFHPNIAVPYLEGRVIEFKNVKSGWRPDWEVVYPYEEPSDLIRVSNSDYLFRVKVEEAVRYLYIDESLGHNVDLPFCNTKATFVNGELTNLEILK